MQFQVYIYVLVTGTIIQQKGKQIGKKKKLLCGYLRIALRQILFYFQVVLSLSLTTPLFCLTNQHENPYLLPLLELFSYFLKVNILQLISISGNQPLQHCKRFLKIARLDALITSKYNFSRKYMFISAPVIFRRQTETKQSEKVTRKITMLSISFSLPHFLKTGMKSSKVS